MYNTSPKPRTKRGAGASKGRRRPIDDNPYNQREERVTEKAFKSVAKSVKPVAKDTNKTRRPRNRPL
jgi:hypothetical protein